MRQRRRQYPIWLALAALLLALGACGQPPLCSDYTCQQYGCTLCEGTP